MTRPTTLTRPAVRHAGQPLERDEHGVYVVQVAVRHFVDGAARARPPEEETMVVADRLDDDDLAFTRLGPFAA